MQTFTDAKGNEWHIELDTMAVREIRKETGVDLLKLDEDSLTALISDDEKLVDVISLICTDQIRRKEMDARSFARCLVGDAIDAACNALIDEVVFISRHAQRRVVAAAWGKTKAAQEMMSEEMLSILNSGAVEKKVTQAMAEFREQLGT